MLYRRDMGVILHLDSDGVMQHAAVILEQDSATYRIEKVPDGALSLRGCRALSWFTAYYGAVTPDRHWARSLKSQAATVTCSPSPRAAVTDPSDSDSLSVSGLQVVTVRVRVRTSDSEVYP